MGPGLWRRGGWVAASRGEGAAAPASAFRQSQAFRPSPTRPVYFIRNDISFLEIGNEWAGPNAVRPVWCSLSRSPLIEISAQVEREGTESWARTCRLRLRRNKAAARRDIEWRRAESGMGYLWRVRLSSFAAGVATASAAGFFLLYKDHLLARAAITRQVSPRPPSSHFFFFWWIILLITPVHLRICLLSSKISPLWLSS